MKRELLPQFLFLVVYFLLITLFKRWFNFLYLPFWLGGVVGLLLPYIDHLIYIYVLYPGADVSVRVKQFIKNKDLKEALSVFAGSDGIQTRKIIHTFYFQALFLLLSVMVITSSGSLFGAGLVLGFSLHLWVLQLKDFMDTGSINNWFERLGSVLDKERQVWFLVGGGGALLLAGLLL